jgi:hypothetical protein
VTPPVVPPVVHPVVHPVTPPVAPPVVQPVSGGTVGGAVGGPSVVPASGPIVTVRPGSPAQPTALPFTGTDATVPLGISLILMGSGIVLVANTRRRALV